MLLLSLPINLTPIPENLPLLLSYWRKAHTQKHLELPTQTDIHNHMGLNIYTHIQLTLEKHGFELHRSTYMHFFFFNTGQWQPTPVLLSGKSHGQRSLVGCSPWGLWESDRPERLHFHFSLSCIGEGNGSPLQCSCLENPRDRGAWWAAIYGVAQSWT